MVTARSLCQMVKKNCDSIKMKKYFVTFGLSNGTYIKQSCNVILEQELSLYSSGGLLQAKKTLGGPRGWDADQTVITFFSAQLESSSE
ncbi:MAG: hypothetical protein ACI9JN_000980 [Bacteroidia bacterium]|jgi:hypothetical protein